YWGKGAVYEACYVETKQKEYLVQMLNFFKKAHDLNPNLAEANISMGWAYFYQEDLDKAYKYFKNALKIKPRDHLVISDAAQFLVSIGLVKPALKLFSQAIQEEPSYMRAYRLKSIAHWSIGEFEEGLKTINERQETEKDDFHIHLLSARSLIMMDQFTRAQEELDEINRIWTDSLKLEPGEQKSSFEPTLALLKAKKGQKDQALELIKDVENQHILPITCVYSLLGMKDEAIDNIRYGIEYGFQKNQSYLYPFPLLQSNPCFDNLREDPRFIEISEQQKKRHKQYMKKYSDLGKK
ncbi:MAG: tetratricopeptide repeat protein, partial [Acidobacteriota bacterium]